MIITRINDSRSAFTLIELLTVIAIIGILAAIVIPTVGKVRESARASQCLSNIRQIQLGNMLYATDNKGIFFRHRGESGAWWLSQVDVLKYLGGAQIAEGESTLQDSSVTMPEKLKCPSITEYRNNNTSAWERAVVPGYAYNRTNASGSNLVRSISGVNTEPIYQEKIPRPSQSIAFADSGDFTCNEGSSNTYAGIDKKVSAAVNYRHKGGANVVFWDGHAKFMKPKDMAKGVVSDARLKPLWRFLAD